MRLAIEDALSWIKAFLQLQHGPLIRQWHLDAVLSSATKVTITFDASPYGFGAVLFIDGTPTEFYADAISQHDERRYQYRVGDSAGQPTWEALAVSIALRLWRDHITAHRTALVVCGDNV